MSKATFFGMSILIAGIISMFRFKKIEQQFLPFLICIWIGGINEIASFILWKTGHYTTVNNNIYVLIEACLYLQFFKNLGVFPKASKLFMAILSGILILWVWENIVEGKIYQVSSWFRIFYSLLIVLLSITTFSKLILVDINKPVEGPKSNLFLNSVFLICLGSIVFFTFKLLIEIFWLYGLNHSEWFRIRIYDILIFINLAVNLVYALSVLWMPTKQQYIML